MELYACIRWQLPMQMSVSGRECRQVTTFCGNMLKVCRCLLTWIKKNQVMSRETLFMSLSFNILLLTKLKYSYYLEWLNGNPINVLGSFQVSRLIEGVSYILSIKQIYVFLDSKKHFHSNRENLKLDIVKMFEYLYSVLPTYLTQILECACIICISIKIQRTKNNL